MSERTFSITGLDVSGYMVEDASRAIQFYRDVLGLEPTTVFPHGNGAEYELADGSTFELWRDGTTPFQPGNGILFAVDDFDAAVAALEVKGTPILAKSETSVCFIAIISDTEGNSVVLHKRKVSPLSSRS
jgi:predicted enzyme related to lactoylglutathione lyase